MKTRLALTLAGAALTALALAGCSATTGTAPGATTPAPVTSAPSASAAAGNDAAVATTALGKIVVDGKGMTAYFFDKDKAGSGTSACTGQCAALWPAITAASGTPSVTGITGTVGTITGVAGGKQITINGRPIYTYAKDTAPGETKGQGVNGVWYVISPAGDELKTAAGRTY
ncbi:MAG: COG4315 family predicted lipoprotein [Microbacteriaceae bacterium]